MKSKMELLRADMMTRGAFTPYERRQMKYLTKANEAQRQYVKAALPPNHLARRWMETCGEVDEWGNIDYCGVPLCPRCHMRQRTVQTGKAIKKIFCDAGNDELAFATILLPSQLDFSGMTDLIEGEKRRLRTFIDRQRKKDSRWNDFQLMGWWEIDRMSFGDFESCGRNTRIALDALGFPLMESPNKTIWRPHLHAIIRKGKLTTEEIACALRKETHTAKYQVDIQPFRAHRNVRDNIKSVVRYCLKFRIERDYKAPDAQDFVDTDKLDNAKPTDREWWPTEDIRQYVDWLCLERDGFQSLRVMIGRAKACSVADVSDAELSPVPVPEGLCDVDTSIDPMVYRSSGDVTALNTDGTIVAEDIHVSGVRGDVRHCMYNNIIQDTNWTDIDHGSLIPGNRRTEVAAIIAPHRYVGNVVSLSERLRCIMELRQANGSLRSAVMQSREVRSTNFS